MNPAVILDSLRRQEGITLNKLPGCSGVYALRDHRRAIRYIGIAHSEGFRVRIRNKHATGSEDRSHKFSAAYNTGRLWRDRHGGFKEDAAISKRLRNCFILKHCTASYFEVSSYSAKCDLERIESGIIEIADPEEILWNGKFKAVEGPTALVGALISEIGLSAQDRDAIHRQGIRCSERPL